MQWPFSTSSSIRVEIVSHRKEAFFYLVKSAGIEVVPISFALSARARVNESVEGAETVRSGQCRYRHCIKEGNKDSQVETETTGVKEKIWGKGCRHVMSKSDLKQNRRLAFLVQFRPTTS